MTFRAVDSRNERTFDAIVVGTGISGGWAAKELTGRGLQTLVLERGRDVKHVTDYPTTMLAPWELEHRGQVTQALREAYPIASKNYAFREDTAHFFTKDAEQPYVQDQPYDWIKAYQVGGRSLLWGRMTQRWSDFDFGGPLRDGYAVDWPIRYADLAPWYSHVEKFIGVSGHRDGLPQLPDGAFLPPHELNCAEKHFIKKSGEKYPDRPIIIGRVAHLTKPQPIHLQQGRAQCQHRNLCDRGCPYGGYFSSNASTIPWAARTGKMTLRPHSVVHSVIYDEGRKRAVGVRVVDTQTREMTEYYARLIFLNAATMNTNLILLNSQSNRFPDGLGNDHGVLGKYVAFHSYRGRVYAEYDGLTEFRTDGIRPNAAYMPRFRNLHRQETDFLRGYAVAVSAGRPTVPNTEGWGADLKKQLLQPPYGNWNVSASMMGETIPKEVSRVQLHPTLQDPYGIPQLRISLAYDDNDRKMLNDFFEQLSGMFENAGFTRIRKVDTQRTPGNENHEMGGVRMGKDPRTSMLNRWNQLHSCPNVFVTDGACMTSTSTQNPSLTYMALTARAVDYAVNQLKTQKL